MAERPRVARRSINRDESVMAEDHQEHVTTTEARAGATPHMARYVLIFGTSLVIIAFAIILFVVG